MALPDSMVKNMSKFQAKNDLPIFLKGGSPDKILFGITAVGCGLGILSVIHLVYQMGFAKKGGN